MYVQQINSYQNFTESIEKIKELYENKLTNYTNKIYELEEELEKKNKMINQYEIELNKKDELLTITQAENKMNNEIIKDLENKIHDFMEHEQNQIKKLNDFHNDYKKYYIKPERKEFDFDIKYYSYIDNVIKNINKSLVEILPCNHNNIYYKIDSLKKFNIGKNKNIKIEKPREECKNGDESISSQTFTDFFNDCRTTMRKYDYAQLIKIMKKANSDLMTKKETYNLINELLDTKYPQLQYTFQKIFLTYDENKN